MKIEINLLGGARKKKATGGGLSLPDFSELAGKVKDPLLMGAVGAWAVSLLFVGFFFTATKSQVSGLEDQASQARNEASRYRDLRAEQGRAMRLRDSLITELSAIRAIDEDRYIWPHILDEVTKALPDYTWLVGLRALEAPAALGDSGPPPAVKFLLDGRTSEIAAYTRFLRQLANSPWVSLVEDGPARRVTEDGRNLTSFEITVTFRVADSSFILTVPVTESVR